MGARDTNWVDEIISEALPNGLSGGGFTSDDLPSVSTLTGRSLDLLRNAAGHAKGMLDDWHFGPQRAMKASMPDAMHLVGMGLMRRQARRLAGQADFFITDAGREVLAEAERPVGEASAWGDPWTASPAEVAGMVSSGIVKFQGLSGVPATVVQAQAAPQVVLLVANSGNTYDVAFSGGQFTFTPLSIVHKAEWGPGGPIMLAQQPVQEIEKPPGPITVNQYIRLVGMPFEATRMFKRFLDRDSRSGRVNTNTMMAFDEWEKMDLDWGDVWGEYTFEAMARRTAGRPTREAIQPGQVYTWAVAQTDIEIVSVDASINEVIVADQSSTPPGKEYGMSLDGLEQLLQDWSIRLKAGRRPVRAAGQMTARQFHDLFVDPVTLSYDDVRAWMMKVGVNPIALQSEDYWYEIFKDFSPEQAPPDPAVFAARRPVEEGTYRERRNRRLRASIPDLHDRVKWVLSSTTKLGLTADLVGAALEMSTAEAAEVLAALVQKGEVEEMAAGVFRLKATVKRSRETLIADRDVEYVSQRLGVRLRWTPEHGWRSYWDRTGEFIQDLPQAVVQGFLDEPEEGFVAEESFVTLTASHRLAREADRANPTRAVTYQTRAGDWVYETAEDLAHRLGRYEAYGLWMRRPMIERLTDMSGRPVDVLFDNRGAIVRFAEPLDVTLGRIDALGARGKTMASRHVVFHDTPKGPVAHIANYTIELWHGGGLWGVEIINNITGKLVDMYDHSDRAVVEQWVDDKLEEIGVVARY